MTCSCMLIPEKPCGSRTICVPLNVNSPQCRCADRSHAFDTEHQMDSTLDDKLGEGQIASLEEQLSNLTREAGVSPSAPLTSMKTSRAPLATIHRLADWRHVAFGGSLLAASIG